jgi:adenosylcobinamide-phosphate synthase
MIVAAYLLDCVAGDPEWLPHPVRLIGAGISWGERRLRWRGQSQGAELAAGGLLALGIVAASYGVAAGLIRAAYRYGADWGAGMEVLLGWTCLAARSLEVEARAVVDALESGDLVRARLQVARIVGRDTEGLDAGEISRAVVETVAESLSDGVMAPLVFLVVGGVPLAMAYKAANTLDSMIGHADERYLYFGRVAARMDDAANLLPSRLTAMAIVGVAGIGQWASARAAMRVWLRDGGRHRSPNAGQPEAAMAGALGVRLGGVNFYRGERVETAVIGGEFGGASVVMARRAMRVAAVVTVVGAVMAGWIVPRGRRG